MGKKILLDLKVTVKFAKKIYFRIKKSKKSVCQMGTMDKMDFQSTMILLNSIKTFLFKDLIFPQWMLLFIMSQMQSCLMENLFTELFSKQLTLIMENS